MNDLLEAAGRTPVNLVPEGDVDPEVSNRAQIEEAAAKERHLQGFPVIGNKPEHSAENARRKKEREEQLRAQNSEK